MKNLLWVVGIDEVGRGPIAGPVTVCAVAMPVDRYRRSRFAGLTDSKQMTAAARQAWHTRARFLETEGRLNIAIATATAAQIDKKGIAVCIRGCISKALSMLDIDPAQATVLLDGSLKAPAIYSNQTTIIKGDAKKKIISLASVIAKVTRDIYMHKQARRFPGYGWERNVGYGTQEHYRAITKLGVTTLHRKTYLKPKLDI